MTWNLLGHQWAIELLQGHIRNQRVRHAYLFTGPQGVGRRTLALRFAQALNCPRPSAPGVPCGTCRVCRQIEKQQHPDLFVVQAEEEGGVLKVEQIRQLQRHLNLTPYEGTYRVGLLLHFEKAHPSAANALLKTLEEPPPHVVLLLTAHSAEELLPTITSRCEVLRLRPMAPDALAQALNAGYAVPPERAAFLAHLSHGRPGVALRWHREPALLAERQEHLQALAHLLQADLLARFAFAEQWAKKGGENRPQIRALLQTWLDFWRDVLRQTANPSLPVANQDLLPWVQALRQQMSLTQTHALVNHLLQSLEDLDAYVHPRLILEALLLELPHLPASIPFGADAAPNEPGAR